LSGRRGFRPEASPGTGTRISRLDAVRKLAHDLQRHGWPRLEMTLIVAITGAGGFFASLLLLSTGVEQMWQRYPLAVAIAYVLFLLELWAWMHLRGESDEPSVDIDLLGELKAPGSTRDHGIGHGGDFGGGGASGSFEAPDSTDPVGDAFSAVGDVPGVADLAEGEGCAVVIVIMAVIALAGGLLLAAIYLVSGAPLLLAELLVDGALSYGLYRKLRKQDRGFWLATAVRRTYLVFLLTAAFLSAAGAAMAWRHPGAHTLGEVLQAGPATSGR
jgi:hypothetical protein